MGNRLVLAALAVWVAALTAGFVSLWRYKASSSLQDEGPPAQWPLDSSLRHATDRATLVLFAHPRCACTHASVTELARLMARMSGSLAARVSIVRPAGIGAGWDDTELAARAAAIPGVTVSVDDGGVEAERFGVRTSGYTVLSDATGRRLFNGGITSARGHEGESFGSHGEFEKLSLVDRSGCWPAATFVSSEGTRRSRRTKPWPGAKTIGGFICDDGYGGAVTGRTERPTPLDPTAKPARVPVARLMSPTRPIRPSSTSRRLR